MKLGWTSLFGASVVMAGLAAVPTAPTALAKDKTVLYMECFSISMDRGASGTIEIGIERWSEPGELDQLKTVLVEQGTDELLKTVQKIKPRAGFIRTTNTLGWDIHFAQKTPLPGGGSKVIFITDRPISGLEARRNDRSMDYQFQLAQIHLDKDGGKKGEGTYVGAARVTYDKDKNTIGIENYGSEPVRLSQVQVR